MSPSLPCSHQRTASPHIRSSLFARTTIPHAPGRPARVGGAILFHGVFQPRGLYQRLCWLTHGGVPNRGGADSRRHGGCCHAISGEIARGLFGRGSSGVGAAVEDGQPEPAASVAGCGQGWTGSAIGGEDRRHGPPDPARLGPSLQRLGSGGPHRQLDRGSQIEALFVDLFLESQLGRPDRSPSTSTRPATRCTTIRRARLAVFCPSMDCHCT